MVLLQGSWIDSDNTSFMGAFNAMPGGKGLNQAVAMSRLGVRTHLIGCVAHDPMSKVLTEFLEYAARGPHLPSDFP